MAEHANGSGGMRSMYFVWSWLLGITGVEVFLAYLALPLGLMLVCLLGLSLVKAALIMGYFMHLKFERLSLVLTVIPAMVLCILLLSAFLPDAMRIQRMGVNRLVPPPAAGVEHP